jgi:hypothetical protein
MEKFLSATRIPRLAPGIDLGQLQGLNADERNVILDQIVINARHDRRMQWCRVVIHILWLGAIILGAFLARDKCAVSGSYAIGDAHCVTAFATAIREGVRRKAEFAASPPAETPQSVLPAGIPNVP